MLALVVLLQIDKPEPRPLQPLVYESETAALDHARKRGGVALVAVGMGELPELFRDARIARISRMTASLASIDYVSESEFFKSRRLTQDATPCLLVLDSFGNLLERQDPGVTAPVLAASLRNAQNRMRKIVQELPGVLSRAKELAAGDEPTFLEFVRPWLARHYRGYAEAEELRTLVVDRGRRRGARDAESLRALARDYAESPLEAEALFEVASLEEPAAAKATLRRILDDLPWPENAEVHRKARERLAQFRREEIERRKRQLDK